MPRQSQDAALAKEKEEDRRWCVAMATAAKDIYDRTSCIQHDHFIGLAVDTLMRPGETCALDATTVIVPSDFIYSLQSVAILSILTPLVTTMTASRDLGAPE